MLGRLPTVPLAVRVSWLWPALTVPLALLLARLYPQEPRSLFAGLARFDAVVTATLLTLWLTPRGGRTLRLAGTVGLRGALLVGLAFPEVRGALWLEGAALGLAALHLRRGLRTPLPADFHELDDLERGYAFWTRLHPSPRVVRLAVYDLTLFRHLLARPRLPQGQLFGTRRGATTGSTFALLGLLAVVEGLLTHTLLARWHPLAAWAWTGVEVTGLLWLLAYGRALATRPVTLTAGRLYLRSGLHWTGSVPLDRVTGARPHDPARDAEVLNIAIDVKPNVTLHFAAPQRVQGVYWAEREVRAVTLHVDDPQAFLAALEEARAAPCLNAS